MTAIDLMFVCSRPEGCKFRNRRIYPDYTCDWMVWDKNSNYNLCQNNDCQKQKIKSLESDNLL